MFQGRLAAVSTLVAAALSTFGLWSVSAAAGVPADTAQALDLGPTDVTRTVSASLVLKVRHPKALERAVASTQDPGDGSYHRFATLSDFVSRYAPSGDDIASIGRYLGGFGITLTEVFADQLLLKVTGTVDGFNRAFATDVHDYQRDGVRFHRPHHRPSIPAPLADLLLVVGGPSDEALFHPMQVKALVQAPLWTTATVLPASGTTATGVPGSYTVGDVANRYNVNPLYRAHIDGRGRTIGIATLANFAADDAYEYWNLIGLGIDHDRITQVHVDGGGPLSSKAASGETCLDVEQAGGLAPGAKIVVYDAPNTETGFIDVFYKAVSDNLVDALSVSWGTSEASYYAAVTGRDTTGQLLAFHQVFLEAALQGISLFAAAGDHGAYAVNTGYDQPFANVLSIDTPASDPAITAAGGTSTPFALPADPGAPVLGVSAEQVWGWDYVRDYFVAAVGISFENNFFPAGGGGGVSIFWPRPSYQARTSGMRVTESAQSVTLDDGSGPRILLDLPTGFAGRNVPDVSLGADPFSGFLVYSSQDGGLVSGVGGTSFVAPQLAGVCALFAQAEGGRVGLWNPMLYRFKKAYPSGASAPINDIVGGDNWYYQGVAGYEPGAGLGVLDVANLAAAIARERPSAPACH